MNILPGSMTCSRGSILKFYTYIHPDGHLYQTSALSKAEATRTFENMVAGTQRAREKYDQWVLQTPIEQLAEASQEPTTYAT